MTTERREDPWGRDPDDVVDENLDDLYSDGNRKPSVGSVDRWGEDLEPDDEERKLKSAQNTVEPEAEPPLGDDGVVFAKNTKPPTPAAGSKPGSPVVSDFKPRSRQQSPLPESKPGTPKRQTPVSRRESPVPSEIPKSESPDSEIPKNQSPTPASKPGTPKRQSPIPAPSPESEIPISDSWKSSTPPPRGSPVLAQSKPGSPKLQNSKPGSPLPPVVGNNNNSKHTSRAGSAVIPPISRRSSQQKEDMSRTNSATRSSSNNGRAAQQPNGPLRSDSKTIRDDSLVLPKSEHRDEIRRKAFENMKNEKARPNYLFIKFPRVVEAVLRYLPYKSLCKSQLVCRVWYRVGKAEKLRRNFVDSDCYKLELTHEDIAKDEDDDLQIDLYRILDDMYVQPVYIVAFMTWRTVTTLPDMLFRILPLNCATTCVASDSGIFGTRKNGKIRIYADPAHESTTVLFIPKLSGFQIFQFSAYRPDQLKLDERFFDSAGLKRYDDKKSIKCLLIFCSGGKSKNANELTGKQIEKWENEFRTAFQSRTLIVGASVNFCQHGVKKIFGGPSPKLYSTQNDVNGMAFQGENLDVQSFIFDKIDDQSLNGQLDKIGVFIGQSPANSFAVILNNLSVKEEQSILKQFKDVLPNTRIAGVKTSGVIFGQTFNSFTDRTVASKQQRIFVGQQYLVLILFRISKHASSSKNNKSKNSASINEKENASDGKKILKASKVK